MTTTPYAQALILAAGMGTRLNPVTGNRYPKPFQPVGGIALIDRAIGNLRKLGVTDIVIVTGHHAEAFESLAAEPDVRLVHNPRFDTHGSAASLLCAADAITEPFLLLEADLLFEHAAIGIPDDARSANRIITSTPVPLDDNVYVSTRDGVLTSVSKRIPESGGDVVMTGIWALTAGFMARLRDWADHTGADISGHYEELLAAYSVASEAIRILHKDDLLWCEVDHEDHLRYAESVVMPRLGNDL